MSILVMYPRFSQIEWIYPLVYSQFKLESIGEHRTNKKQITLMAFSSLNKKLKQTLIEIDSNYDTETPFPRFIIIESTEELIANLSPLYYCEGRDTQRNTGLNPFIGWTVQSRIYTIFTISRRKSVMPVVDIKQLLTATCEMRFICPGFQMSGGTSHVTTTIHNWKSYFK